MNSFRSAYSATYANQLKFFEALLTCKREQYSDHDVTSPQYSVTPTIYFIHMFYSLAQHVEYVLEHNGNVRVWCYRNNNVTH